MNKYTIVVIENTCNVYYSFLMTVESDSHENAFNKFLSHHNKNRIEDTTLEMFEKLFTFEESHPNRIYKYSDDSTYLYLTIIESNTALQL